MEDCDVSHQPCRLMIYIYDPNARAGAGYLVDSSAVFLNCTINENYSEPNGAAICLFDSNAVLVNCILWDNQPQEFC